MIARVFGVTRERASATSITHVSRSISQKTGVPLRLWFTNRVVWMAVGVLVFLQLLFVYAPFLNRWFHTAPLTPRDWLMPVGIGVAIFLVVEFEKAVVRRFATPSGRTDATAANA